MVKFLSSKLHGFIDYAAAVALIIVPFLIFPGVTESIAFALSVVAGIALIVYSLVTDYSISVRNILPFKTHLAIDFIAGLGLIAIPFIFGFTDIVQIYYIVMGIAVLLVVMVTRNDIDSPDTL